MVSIVEHPTSMPRLLPALLILLAPLSLLTSCGSTATSRPSSIGGLDEVLFVEDENLRHDTAYAYVDDRLRAHFGAFPFHEPTFDVINLQLGELNNLMSHHRNMLFVGVFDRESPYNDYLRRLLGEENVARVEEGGCFTLRREDLWADGQFIHCIAASDRETLMAGLPRAMDQTVENIRRSEEPRVKRIVYANKTDVQLTRDLAEDLGIHLDIPSMYKLHPRSGGNYRWYRRSTIDKTSSLMVLTHPYRRNVEMTPGYAIFLRDSLGRRYERSEIEGAYMTTEKLVRPIVDTVRLGGCYAFRTHGLWRMEHDWKGGPFVSYLILDEAGGRIIFLEAYVYNPDTKRGGKRRMVREMDALLGTFRPLPPESSAS